MRRVKNTFSIATYGRSTHFRFFNEARIKQCQENKEKIRVRSSRVDLGWLPVRALVNPMQLRPWLNYLRPAGAIVFSLYTSQQ